MGSTVERPWTHLHGKLVRHMNLEARAELTGKRVWELGPCGARPGAWGLLLVSAEKAQVGFWVQSPFQSNLKVS